MIPITRATLQSFCRICLQELPSNNSTKELVHDIKNEGFRGLVNSVIGVSMDISSSSCLPHSMCHSCYIKTNALKSFRDKSIISTGVLKLLICENLRKTTLDELKLLCRVCLKKQNLISEPDSCSQIYDCMYQCTGLRLTLNKDDADIDNFSNDLHFPQYFCSRCCGSLKNFMDFRSVARQTNGYLKNLLDGVVDPKHECKNENIIIEDNNYYEVIGAQSELDTSSRSIGYESALDFEVPIEITALTTENTAESVDNNLSIIENKPEPSLDDDIFWRIEEPKYNRKVAENRKSQRRKSFEVEKDLCLESKDVVSTKTIKHCSKKRINIKSTIEPKNNKVSLKCNECKKSFYKKYMFEAHMKVHKGIDKPFECPYCPSNFRLVQVLNRHISDRHSTLEMNSNNESKGNQVSTISKSFHLCLYCQRPFKRKDHLKEHIRAVHEGLKPFKCSVCGKAFASKNTQIRHEQNHSKERPFVCDFCTKRYNSESELKVHIQRHTTKPDLLCPICKRGKPNEEELKKHIAMHEASRQHQCPKCGKVFTKLFHLREHDNTVHLKLRPFKCSRCEQTFGVRKTLKTHEQSHFSIGRPEICNICELYFKSKRALLIHTKRIHASPEL